MDRGGRKTRDGRRGVLLGAALPIRKHLHDNYGISYFFHSPPGSNQSPFPLPRRAAETDNPQDTKPRHGFLLHKAYNITQTIQHVMGDDYYQTGNRK
jgi:hypothetical protein